MSFSFMDSAIQVNDSCTVDRGLKSWISAIYAIPPQTVLENIQETVGFIAKYAAFLNLSL
jgi:hypothetical protein